MTSVVCCSLCVVCCSLRVVRGSLMVVCWLFADFCVCVLFGVVWC